MEDRWINGYPTAPRARQGYEGVGRKFQGISRKCQGIQEPEVQGTQWIHSTVNNAPCADFCFKILSKLRL